MSDDIKDIFNRVKLTDELAGETKKRPEVDIKSNHTFKDDDTIDSHLTSESDDLSSSAFDVLDDLETEAPKKEAEPLEEFDAEASAMASIDIIDVLQQSLFMPISAAKLQKRFGGKEKIKEMRQALAKSVLQEKLTDEEKVLVAQLKSFNARLKEVRTAIPFNDVDIAALKPSTIKFCEKHGIKVNEGLAFGAGLVKALSPRVIDLILI